MKSGVYCFRNSITTKVYVGSAIHLCKRQAGHISQWQRDKAVNPKLLNAIRKYGIAAFVFEVLEYCEPAVLLDREAYWIAALRSVSDGYNVRHIPNSNLGLVFSQEVRAKNSASNKGRIPSATHRANISLAKKGKPQSAEDKARLIAMHEANKGKSHSVEHRQKIAASLKGKIVSAETSAKLAKASRKLSDQDIRDIVTMIEQGVRHSEIRERFHISERTCSSIHTGSGIYARFKLK